MNVVSKLYKKYTYKNYKLRVRTDLNYSTKNRGDQVIRNKQVAQTNGR